MKILSISNCPLVESQGSGYVALNFIRGLRGLGHEVDAFGPEDFEPLTRLRRGRNLRLAWGMAWCALKKLFRKRYDVVEFYGGHAWLIAAMLRWLPNRRCLVINHTNGLEPFCAEEKSRCLPSPASPWRAAVPIHWAYSKVDGIVTVSHIERRYAVRKNLQEENRVAAFENPLPEFFLNRPLSPDREPVIMFCGSWLPRKGSHIIRADMPDVLREFPDYRFRLVGVGREFRKEDHFPADVCDRIEVVPFLADKFELREAYESARVVIVPSIYESFGLVVAEAMACGCAVVTTNTGFGAELKQGREAILMKERRSPALREALRQVLSNDSFWRRIAACGHGRVQTLRWATAVEGLEQVYSSWLQERQGCPDASTPAQPKERSNGQTVEISPILTHGSRR